jgi:hypothetical protein
MSPNGMGADLGPETSMDEWKPVFVLPNLDGRGKVQCEFAAIVPANDHRVAKLCADHPILQTFLSKFSGQFEQGAICDRTFLISVASIFSMAADIREIQPLGCHMVDGGPLIIYHEVGRMNLCRCTNNASPCLGVPK